MAGTLLLDQNLDKVTKMYNEWSFDFQIIYQESGLLDDDCKKAWTFVRTQYENAVQGEGAYIFAGQASQTPRL